MAVVPSAAPKQEDELDPTDLESVFFRRVRLTDEQRQAIAKDLDELYRDAIESRGDLEQLLAHWNDMAEGIAQPKNFPWENSSNLFVPITEIHLNNLHASARQTLLKGDQLAYVKQLGMNGDPASAARAEQFLNYKCATEIPLLDRLNQLTWCTLRDGTGIGQVQWKVKKEPISRIVDFDNPAEFAAQYPDPESAGLTEQQYDRVLAKLHRGERASLVVETDEVTYRGPSVTAIQLSDFLLSPITVPRTEMARLVGKRFEVTESELKANEKHQGWQDIDKVLTRKTTGLNDLNTTLKDQIEGIYRKQVPQGVYVLVDGIHRYDLNGDGQAERYLAVYHPETKTLVDYLHYPYLHGRDCFVPTRIKKRPNHFLGRGICHMLDDLNSEINTQHNQRIDSRTISTVPTFKALNSAKGVLGFDPARPQTRFRPGGIIWLNQMADVEQFKITQTDMGETLQEESTLFSLADQLTGSSQLRSGKETKADPRAPAAKVNLLLNQSNLRLDDWFEELAGNAIDNEGFAAILTQILELYYQFYDPDLDVIPLVGNDGKVKTDQSGQPVPVPVKRSDLSVRGRLRVLLAKTSTAMNPDSVYLKFLQVFSLLIKEPTVAGVPQKRIALIRNLLRYARVDDPEQYLPTPQELQAVLTNQQGQATIPQGKGPGDARTVDGQAQPRTPAAGGSTRPAG